MRKPALVTAAMSKIAPELAQDKKAAQALYDFTADAQSAEYIAAAKAVNAQLRAAGLSALVLVEA
jgi:hypothetical protein